MTAKGSLDNGAVSIVRAHVVRAGKALLALRRRPSEQWSTFGGWVETGELPDDALRRELREELAIEVEAFQRLPDRTATSDGRPARVAVFAVTAWQGEPRNVAAHEHAAISWFSREDLKTLPMHEQARSEAIALLRN